MKEQRKINELIREELYDAVWTTPGCKLKAEFGISDVAIAKWCKKLDVPRPHRGYWNKLEVGTAPDKTPLPPTPDERLILEAQKPIPQQFPLPRKQTTMHPLAARFLNALQKAELSYDKQRVRLYEQAYPSAEVSKAQAKRAAGVFHHVLRWIEPCGIFFVSEYGGGCFKRDSDSIFFSIEEALVEKPEILKHRKKGSSSWREVAAVPCGHLTFILTRRTSKNYPNRWPKKKWTASEETSLETIIVALVKEVREYFVEALKRREAEAIAREQRRIQEEIEEERQLQEEVEQEHAGALKEIIQSRRDNLLKASQWWRLYLETETFITACEQRWKAQQSDTLTHKQEKWLRWARETAKELSPFESSYPNPSQDGAFDPSSVPFGGPYPKIRDFPRPPTMPELIVQQNHNRSSYYPEPKSYPFWLRHK